MIKYKDTSFKVSEVQKYLSFLGYDLIVDGWFFDKTLRSVKAFQKKVNLDSTGEVCYKTFEALKAAQKRTSKEEKYNAIEKNYKNLDVTKDYKLDSSQFVKQVTEKDKIFIHFTNGRKSATQAITSWSKDELNISSAYVIDAFDGKIYECFNPDYWGWHLGVKGTNGVLDRKSIGVELCSYGPLKKVGDKFFAWPSNWSTEVDSSEVYVLEDSYRGNKYYHSYSNEQLESLEKILDFLIDHYEINIQESFGEGFFEFNEDLILNRLPGIWTHSSCRKDKLDSYPDHRLLEILNRLSKKFNS